MILKFDKISGDQLNFELVFFCNLAYKKVVSQNCITFKTFLQSLLLMTIYIVDVLKKNWALRIVDPYGRCRQKGYGLNGIN